MSQQFIDLRSDTVTKPSKAMREAMANAEVGDDVFGDDPSVNLLESLIAGLLEKEASLFVPSGTMANQLAIRCHTTHGDEILIDANAHIYWYEAGGPAALSGVTCKLLPGQRGIFSAEDIQSALRPKNVHYPRTSEDDLPENQCSDVINKKTSRFIELDQNGNLVRIVD